MKKIFVAIPTTGTVVDLLPQRLRELEARYKDTVQFVYPDKTIRRIFHDFARNALCEDFLESGADCLWFVDSDVVPPPHVLDLVAHHWDKWQVAGAPYPVFMTPPGSEIPEVVICVYKGTDGHGLNAANVPMEGTEFVDGLATGCMFIKREVLEAMPRPFFEFKYDESTRCITRGEDLDFCLKVKAMGHQFFVDYSMICKHVKTVDLLDVNNYAIQFANKSVLAYDQQIRGQVAELAARLKVQSAQQRGLADPSANSTGEMSPIVRAKPQLILAGHASPFAQGTGR